MAAIVSVFDAIADGGVAPLKDTPRNATAIARTGALPYGLDKEPFLAAVTGHASTARAAQEVVPERLVTISAQGR